MTGYFFDLYPRTNPLGTVIARLTEAQALKYRGEANGAGVGLISLRGDSDDGQLIDPLGLQYIRVVEDDETVVGGFFLDNGDFAAINEQNTRLLTFTGAGALSYLDREVMWAYTYHPVTGADDPFDRQWRLHAQGFGLGDYLGNSFYRALFEALGFNGATGYRTVTPRNGEKLETAIPAITIGFDGFVDSDGNPWTLPSGDMTVMVGETLYKVAQRHTQAGLYIEVDPDTFECRAWEADGHRRDRTGLAFGADVVRFSKGQNIKSDANRALAPFIKRTEILSVGSDDTPSTATFAGDVPWHGSILPDLTDLDAIHQVAVSEGNRRADAGDTIRLKMRLGADPSNGLYRPWREVLHDDEVTVDSGSGQWDWDEQTFPVAALEISLREAGDWDAHAELGASFASMQNRAFQAVGVAPHPHPPNPHICRDPLVKPSVAYAPGWQSNGNSAIVIPAGLVNSLLVVFAQKPDEFATQDPTTWTADYGGVALAPLPGSDEAQTVYPYPAIRGFYQVNPTADPNGAGAALSINPNSYRTYVVFQDVDLADPIGSVVTALGSSAASATGLISGDAASLPYGTVFSTAGHASHDAPVATSGIDDWSDGLSFYSIGTAGAHGSPVPAWSHLSAEVWVAVGLSINGIGSGGDGPADTVAQGDETFGVGPDVTACDHAHAHGLLSEDETHYHDADHIKDLTSITLSDDDPLMEAGAGDPGTSEEVSRSDHVHPEDDDSGGIGGGGSSGRPLVDPTGLSWSWINQGTTPAASITTQDATLLLHCAAEAADNWHFRVKSVPSKPYSVIAHILPAAVIGVSGACVGWLQTSNNDFAICAQYESGGWHLASSKSGTDFAITANYLDLGSQSEPWKWIRFSDSATVRTIEVSRDGYNWLMIHSVATNDFITPDRLVFGLLVRNGSYPAAVTLDSWEEV